MTKSAKQRWKYFAKKRKNLLDNIKENSESLQTDIKRNQNLSQWEPELCINMLKLSHSCRYEMIKKLLQNVSREWLLEFLKNDGLGVLLQCLEYLSCKKTVTETISQIHCVACLKAVTNSEVGLQFIVQDQKYTNHLATILLHNKQAVKLQVFELLCALCVFSEAGYSFTRATLKKLEKETLRHHLDFLVQELLTADTQRYLTTILAFLNCLMLSEPDVDKRNQIRNELLLKGLESIMDDIKGTENEELQIQINVFEENKIMDHIRGSVVLHEHLFSNIMKKVAKTKHEQPFHSLLFSLSELDYSKPETDKIFELLNDMVSLRNANVDIERILIRNTEDRKNINSNVFLSESKKIDKKKKIIFTLKKNEETQPPESNGNENNILAEKEANIIINNISSAELNDNNKSSPDDIEIRTDDAAPLKPSIIMDHIVQQRSPAMPPPPPPPPPPLPASLYSNIPEIQQFKNAQKDALLNEETRDSQKSTSSLNSIPPPPPPPLPSLIVEVPKFQPQIIQSCPPPPPPPLPPSNSSQAFTGSSSPIVSCNMLPNLAFIPPPPPPPLPSLLASPISSDLGSLSGQCTTPTSSKSTSSSVSAAPIPPPLPPSLQNINAPPPPPPPLMPCNLKGNETASLFTPVPLTPTNQIIENNLSGYNTVPKKANNECKFKYWSLPFSRSKMKTINWTKVPKNKLDKSVWSMSDVPEITLDLQQLEELFSQKHPTSTKNKITSVKQQKIEILDSRRSLAVNIFLKQFKNGPEVILKALQEGTGLTAEQLKGLQKILPEQDELNLLTPFTDKADELGTAERFYLEIAKIKFYHLRTEIMIQTLNLQKEDFPLLVDDIKPKLKDITETCLALRSDTNLRGFLGFILNLGNTLNAGSYAGNAAGFKLSTLPKLMEVRSNKPRMTLLHFAIETLRGSKNEHLLSFINDKDVLSRLSKTPFASLEEEVKQATNKLCGIEQKLKKCSDSSLIEQYEDFINSSLEEIKNLQNLSGEAKNASSELSIYFCEDPAKFTPEECFQLLSNFYSVVEKYKVENEQQRLSEQRRIKSLEEQTKKPSKAKKKKEHVVEPDKDCLIDLLMNDIRKGSFRLRRTNHSSTK